jgi:hypothetical protein
VPSPLLPLPFFLGRQFLYGLRQIRGIGFTVIGDIKATPFKDNRDGVNDTASLSLTFRAHRYRLLIKTLLPFKMKVAKTTFILINRHLLHLSQVFPTHLTPTASIKATKIFNLPRLMSKKGVKLRVDDMHLVIISYHESERKHWHK